MFSLNKTFSSSSAIEKLWISSRLYFADIKFALLFKVGIGLNRFLQLFYGLGSISSLQINRRQVQSVLDIDRIFCL